MGVFVLVLLISPRILEQRARSQNNPNDATATNAVQLVNQGRQIFRYDTFGDQAFWGDSLKLHQAIEGAGHGGTGPGLSPMAALTLGLKVDVDALVQVWRFTPPNPKAGGMRVAPETA